MTRRPEVEADRIGAGGNTYALAVDRNANAAPAEVDPQVLGLPRLRLRERVLVDHPRARALVDADVRGPGGSKAQRHGRRLAVLLPAVVNDRGLLLLRRRLLGGRRRSRAAAIVGAAARQA